MVKATKDNAVFRDVMPCNFHKYEVSEAHAIFSLSTDDSRRSVWNGDKCRPE